MCRFADEPGRIIGLVTNTTPTELLTEPVHTTVSLGATVTMHPQMSRTEKPHPLAMIAHLARREHIVVGVAL